jgi:hypothetical protein
MSVVTRLFVHQLSVPLLLNGETSDRKAQKSGLTLIAWKMLHTRRPSTLDVEFRPPPFILLVKISIPLGSIRLVRMRSCHASLWITLVVIFATRIVEAFRVLFPVLLCVLLNVAIASRVIPNAEILVDLKFG